MKRLIVLALIFSFMFISSGCNLRFKLFKRKTKKVVAKTQEEIKPAQSSGDLMEKIVEAPASEALTEAVILPEIPVSRFDFLERLPESERRKGEPRPRFSFEVGSVVGFFASATAFSGEARFPLKYIFGPATTSLRLALGYAQSKDTTRRYLPLYVDAILNYPPGVITGVENYIGAGLNYVLLTSGGSAGTFGGEIFYGVEDRGFGGKLFGEMGYGMLRTGVSASHRGISLLMGYRRDWAF